MKVEKSQNTNYISSAIQTELYGKKKQNINSKLL